MNSNVADTLRGLSADLRDQRRVLVNAAATLGIGVVAAGAVPLAVPAEMQVTDTARYHRMLADYQLLAREQLICGTQVHVGVDGRDEAVAVAIEWRRISRWRSVRAHRSWPMARTPAIPVRACWRW